MASREVKRNGPVIATGAIRGNVSNTTSRMRRIPNNQNGDLKDNQNGVDASPPVKPATFSARYFAESTGIPVNQGVKTFVDGLMQYAVDGDIDPENKIAVEFLADNSGSMEQSCDGKTADLSRIDVVNTIEKNAIMTLPTGTIISEVPFATDHVVRIDCVPLQESEEERNKLAAKIVKINLGGGTAIHHTVDRRLFNALNNVEKLKKLKISQMLFVILTDGCDNSGRFPWSVQNLKAGGAELFHKTLDELYNNYIKPINGHGIKVEVMFVAISADYGPEGMDKGIAWDVIRALSSYEKFNTSGRAINTDGRSLMKSFNTYIQKFMNIASTNNRITFKLDAVSAACKVQIRVCDDREASDYDTKDDYGAKSIRSKFRNNQDTRVLADFARGATITSLFQIRFPIEDGKVVCFPKDFEAITVIAELTGDLVPGMESKMLNTYQVKIPLIWDPKVTQFTQVSDKWILRLVKQSINIRCTMSQAYEILDKREIADMLKDVVVNIKKDQDQCLAEHLTEAQQAVHYKLRSDFPFYDPEDVKDSLVGSFTKQIEDMRIMIAMLAHKSFATESRAKMLEWLLPERRGEGFKMMFESVFMSDQEFKESYEKVLSHQIEDDGFEVTGDDTPNTTLLKKFHLVSRRGFKKQKITNDREYDRDYVVALAYVSLMQGLTPEEMAKEVAAAATSQTLTRARYIKRHPGAPAPAP